MVSEQQYAWLQFLEAAPFRVLNRPRHCVSNDSKPYQQRLAMECGFSTPDTLVSTDPEQVWDFYRRNPNALASLRAPIFEEKVVDFLVELAKVTDKPVSREELFKEDDEEDEQPTASSP